jgi:anti-anti-sigma factor
MLSEFENTSREPVGEIVVEQVDGAVVIRLVGEHDLSTEPDLSRLLAQRVTEGVVLSLAETTFIDSTMMRVFYQGDTMRIRHGRRLVLHTSPKSNVNRLLEISGLSDALACCERIEDAIELARRDGGPDGAAPETPRP